MTPLAGPYLAAVLLLGVAGAAKVLRPDPTRVALRTAGLPSTVAAARAVGLVELVVTAYALVGGGRSAAALVAGAYAGFAGFVAVVRHRSGGRASCGCFGASGSPLTGLHVVVDLAIAALAVGAVVDPVGSFVSVARDTPLAGVPFVAFTVLLAWLVQVLLTALPELQAAVRPPRRAVR